VASMGGQAFAWTPPESDPALIGCLERRARSRKPEFSKEKTDSQEGYSLGEALVSGSKVSFSFPCDSIWATTGASEINSSPNSTIC